MAVANRDAIRNSELLDFYEKIKEIFKKQKLVLFFLLILFVQYYFD